MKLLQNKAARVNRRQAVEAVCFLFASVAGCLLAAPLQAQEPKWSELTGELPADFTRLGKNVDVWMSPKRKLVVVDGKVCLREGQLEMFACPRKSKEHESVVAVNSDAKTVHAALLAVGATTGSPVKFDPQFTPPTGTKVDIMLLWNDAAGKPQQRPAQDWVRHVRTKKQLETSWVFAGSGFWTDESSGQRHYQADAGDLVCVSNFPTATLDLPVASSQDNADLQFEAFTDRIPAKGTTVRLVFQPRIPAAPAPAAKDSAPGKQPQPKP